MPRFGAETTETCDLFCGLYSVVGRPPLDRHLHYRYDADMKLTRLKVALGIVVAIVVAVLLATIHGSGSDSIHYRPPGEAPPHNG